MTLFSVSHVPHAFGTALCDDLKKGLFPLAQADGVDHVVGKRLTGVHGRMDASEHDRRIPVFLHIFRNLKGILILVGEYRKTYDVGIDPLHVPADPCHVEGIIKLLIYVEEPGLDPLSLKETGDIGDPVVEPYLGIDIGVDK